MTPLAVALTVHVVALYVAPLIRLNERSVPVYVPVAGAPNVPLLVTVHVAEALHEIIMETDEGDGSAV